MAMTAEKPIRRGGSVVDVGADAVVVGVDAVDAGEVGVAAGVHQQQP